MNLRVTKRTSHLISLLTCSATLTFAPQTYAQNASNNAAAQTLFDAGRALMKKGNYAEACPKLEESQRLDPGSGTLLNLGICYEHLGLTASAWTTYIDAAAASKTAGKADRVKSAQQHADALAPRLSRVTIKVTSDKVAGLEVKRDGTAVRPAQWGTAIVVDPGAHVISATAPGRRAWQSTVNMQDGRTETVVVPELEAAAPSPSAKGDEPSPKRQSTAATIAMSSTPENAESEGPHGQRTIAILAGSIGVAGLAAGTVFGFRSKLAHDDALAFCKGDICSDPRGVDLVDKARGAGNVSTGAFIVGTVGVAAGAILWLTAPKGVKVGFGMDRVQIAGTW